jgi:para-nitrobenzyl esterase
LLRPILHPLRGYTRCPVNTSSVAASTDGPPAGHRSGEVTRFAGVRFATNANLGSRWWPPLLHPPDDRERADRFYAAMQDRGTDPFSQCFPIRGRRTEDALRLNVWTPGRHTSCPVLVWIHGGGFIAGSGSEPMCDGERLARRGIVVVTVNYRLGIFGFVRPDGSDAATEDPGLLDQVAALRWVKDNIARFGGDPERVTVAGNSAGAMSIACLMRMPSARGLFRAAILHSPAADIRLSARSRELLQSVATDAYRSLGVDDPHRAPVGALLDVQRRVMREVARRPEYLLGEVHGLCMPFRPGPAVDPGPPCAIPVIIGTTAHEWRLYEGLDVDDWAADATMRRRLARLSALTGISQADLARSDRRETAALRWTRLQTERLFRLPAVDLADELASAGCAVWSYRFDWSPPGPAKGLGACHGIDVPFVFDTFDSITARTLAPTGEGSAAHSDVQRNWESFIKTGAPRDEQWRSHTTRQRPVYVFGSSEAACRQGLDSEMLERWSGAADNRKVATTAS